MNFSGSPYFHVGLHKTGITFLQENVFTLFEDYYLIRKEFKDLVGYPDNMFNCPEGKGLLVSWERLSGLPWTGSWLGEYKRYVDRITFLFPDARCIIGFRRHDQLVRSFYKQYLQVGGTQRPEYLFSLDGTGMISNEDLQFTRRLEIAREAFSDVHVYTQESLRDNFATVLRGLSHFLETSPVSPKQVDQSRSNFGINTIFQAKLLRNLNIVNRALKNTPLAPTLQNRLFRYLDIDPRSLCQKRLAGMSGTPFTLPKKTESFLRSHFSDDWQYIQEVEDEQYSKIAF